VWGVEDSFCSKGDADTIIKPSALEDRTTLIQIEISDLSLFFLYIAVSNK
jgi:hypothetical protein